LADFKIPQWGQTTSTATPASARERTRTRGRAQARRAGWIIAPALALIVVGVAWGSSGQAPGSLGGGIGQLGSTHTQAASASSSPVAPGSAGGSLAPAGSAPVDLALTGPTASPSPGHLAQPRIAPRPTPRPAVKPATTPKPRAKPKPKPPAGTPVPASINSSGTADASAALIAFIAKVPNGATIVFRAGGVYRMDRAFKFAQRRNLTLNGNGATLRSNGGTTEASALFWLVNDSGVRVTNFKLVGNSSTPGHFQPGREGASGVLVDGGSGITLDHLTVSKVWGDCVEVNSWASGVTFRDSDCVSVGRSGVSIISGRSVTIERNSFVRSGYTVFNIEPNNSSEGASNVRFVSNTAGTWTNSFVSANGAAGSKVSGITISGNRVTGGTLLLVMTIARRSNVVFSNNRSSVSGYGPILRFAHVDGLTISGNVQPLRSGALASVSDCTKVIQH
jgi:hypothetical protein